MKKDICVYCEENKQVRVWKETGELVCYDCRLDFLDDEFKTYNELYKEAHMKRI